MPYQDCIECAKGLHGREGHGWLIPSATTARPDSQRGLFACTVCGTRWRRHYAGDGLFLWQPQNPGGAAAAAADGD